MNVNDLDALMERVNQIATACNECFVRPVLRDDKVDFDIVLPHTAEVYADGTILKAIVYPVELADGTRLYEYWDDTFKIVFDDGKHPVESMTVPHGYGVVPFVTYRRMRPIAGFWLGLDGQDLVHAFDDQVMGRTWINRISYVQSYNQVYREQEEGLGDATHQTINDPTFGPDSIPVGKFRTLDLRTDLRSQLDVLERKLQRVAANWGISADTLNQASHTSGLERLLSFSGLMECRLQTIKHYRPRDKELMKIACKVWNTDGSGKKFSEDPDPRINYA
ncbi:MAG: phage portal protein, partial [Anaerolineales bacterium]|nr:phage portal protein [Anaerolineales bacterium]